MSLSIKTARATKTPRPLLTHSVSSPPEILAEDDEKVICKLEGIALSLTATQAAAAAAAPPPPPTQSLVDTLNKVLKIRGASLDLFDKERMDKVFTSLKQACRVDTLNAASKLKLVEVMEIRAMGWKTNENVENYYRHKLAQLEGRCIGLTSYRAPQASATLQRSQSLNVNAPEFLPIKQNSPPLPAQSSHPTANSEGKRTSKLDEARRLVGLHETKRSNFVGSRRDQGCSSDDYTCRVSVGEDHVNITGTSMELVQAAKLVLDDFFSLSKGRMKTDVNNKSSPLERVGRRGDSGADSGAECGVRRGELKVQVLRQPLFPASPQKNFQDIESNADRRQSFARALTEKKLREEQQREPQIKLPQNISHNEQPEAHEESFCSTQSHREQVSLGGPVVYYSRDELLNLCPDEQLLTTMAKRETTWEQVLKPFPDIRRQHDFSPSAGALGAEGATVANRYSPLKPHPLPRIWEEAFGKDVSDNYVIGVLGASSISTETDSCLSKTVTIDSVEVKRKNFLEVLKPGAPARVWNENLGEWVEKQSRG